MSARQPDPSIDPDDLRRVGAPWRAGGVALVLTGAAVIVVAKAQGQGMHTPLMISGFALLALGWVLAFVGVLGRSLRQVHHPS